MHITGRTALKAVRAQCWESESWQEWCKSSDRDRTRIKRHSSHAAKRRDLCIFNFPPRSLGGTCGLRRESPSGLSNA